MKIELEASCVAFAKGLCRCDTKKRQKSANRQMSTPASKTKSEAATKGERSGNLGLELLEDAIKMDGAGGVASPARSIASVASTMSEVSQRKGSACT